MRSVYLLSYVLFLLSCLVHGLVNTTESFAITYCHQLKFQWMPKELSYGNLIVTKELEIEHEVKHMLITIFQFLHSIESVW